MHLIKYIRYSFNYFRYFIYPNAIFLSRKQLIMGRTRRFNQTTLLRGNGRISIGNHCSFGFDRGGFHRNGNLEFQARTKDSTIEIGSNVSMNNNIFICSSGSIVIEDNCLIGQFVTMMDFEAHDIDPNNRMNVGEIGFIKLERNVWIGNNVIILKNTHIGSNSIVAAGAVVSGSFPENVVLGGVPAKVIKHLI